MPQGSILGPILFNIFRKDLFLCLTKSDLDHFADDNTIAVTCKNLKDLLRVYLKKNQNQLLIGLGTIT